jgi:hypothetical protein
MIETYLIDLQSIAFDHSATSFLQGAILHF